jgi:hypothetical protein
LEGPPAGNCVVSVHLVGIVARSKHRLVIAVAFANKTVPIGRAIMRKEDTYRHAVTSPTSHCCYNGKINTPASDYWRRYLASERALR